MSTWEERMALRATARDRIRCSRNVVSTRIIISICWGRVYIVVVANREA